MQSDNNNNFFDIVPSLIKEMKGILIPSDNNSDFFDTAFMFPSIPPFHNDTHPPQK
jgi:hypothetical protein